MRGLMIVSPLTLFTTLAVAAPPAETNVHSALERIARVDPQLHSIIAVDPTATDQARRIDAGNLRGPLAGRPVLIKENLQRAGRLPTTAATLALRTNITDGHPPRA